MHGLRCSPEIPGFTRLLDEWVVGLTRYAGQPEGVFASQEAFERSFTEACTRVRAFAWGAGQLEPTHVGADLIAGSLIKNPGGTLVRTGGYIAGRAALVQAAKNRLAAPGVGGGATLGQNGQILQGLFMAPATVGESLKGAMLCAQVRGI